MKKMEAYSYGLAKDSHLSMIAAHCIKLRAPAMMSIIDTRAHTIVQFSIPMTLTEQAKVDIFINASRMSSTLVVIRSLWNTVPFIFLNLHRTAMCAIFSRSESAYSPMISAS